MPAKPELSALPWDNLQKILVVRLDNIGDVIMTTPVLRSLRQALPQAEITLLASPAGALTQPLLPWVNQVIPWATLWQALEPPPFDPQAERQLIQTLEADHFDAAIILTSFNQSPHPAATVCYLAGIPIRAGESQEHSDVLTHAVPPTPVAWHQVERNLHLVEAVGLPVRDRSLSLSRPRLDLPVSPPYMVLNPWTSCPARNYAPESFAAAARELAQHTRLPVVVTGMPQDRSRSMPILKALGDWAIDLIGQTSLSQLVALIAQARLLLTNNTSTMHIADAVRTPALVMFAGTELEAQWRPRSSPATLLRQPTHCSPCYAFTCPYQQECLDISVGSVVAAGLRLLQPSLGETLL